MAMYALSRVPLISAVTTSNVRQTWYADYASAGGKLYQIRSWWDQHELKGPKYGYYVNNSKIWLVVKEEFMSRAEILF